MFLFIQKFFRILSFTGLITSFIIGFHVAKIKDKQRPEDRLKIDFYHIHIVYSTTGLLKHSKLIKKSIFNVLTKLDAKVIYSYKYRS